MKTRFSILRSRVACDLAIMCAVVLAMGANTAQAAGVVGTGIAASCTDAALDAALASGGLVTFDCGGPATIDISMGTGTKVIAADTTIDGGGLITISGGHSVDVFSQKPGVEFMVENLTIANGGGEEGEYGIANPNGTLTVANCTFTGNRGGISNGNLDLGDKSHTDGTLTVTDSTFMGNGVAIFNMSGTLTVTDSTLTANGGGLLTVGGIVNGGTLTITNSTFTANSGGIGNLPLSPPGFARVTNCTFSDNSANGSNGGGIDNSGTLTVTNSTFSDNGAYRTVAGGGGGGAIFNAVGGALTVINSTFTGNRAGFGGGAIYGSAWLRNTIVANSPSGGNCSGSMTDAGHNLDDGTSCGFSTANGSLSGTDPLLDPAGLQDNGGPTATLALCTAVGIPDPSCTGPSPAIGAGDQAVCAATPVDNRDQRGFVRPGTGHTQCSIGAYEADGTAPGPCTGDCDGKGSVTVDEILALVNIALGSAQASACLNGVPGGAAVDVALILQAVNDALSGCGG